MCDYYWRGSSYNQLRPSETVRIGAVPNIFYSFRCGHGPQLHDVLSIIWRITLVDGATREQHCAAKKNRLGDMFHPDLIFGKPVV